MGNVVESAWTNNPTKRCVVKFSNTLSEGIDKIIDSFVKSNELILSFEDFKKRENIKNNNLGNKSFENLKTSVDELYYVFKNIQLSLIKK